MAWQQVVKNVSNIIDDLAETIRNPPENRPVAGAVGRAGQAYCDWYGSVQDGVEALGGPARAQTDLICGPYFGDQGYDPPVNEPPFTGGQCPKLYNVTGTWESQVTSASVAPTEGNWAAGTWTTVQNASFPTGPIRGVLADPAGSFSVWRLGVQFGTSEINIDIFPTGGGGQVFRFDGTLRGASTRWARNVEITSIVVRNGTPDDCGDPDDEFKPGANPPPAPPPFPPGQEPGQGADGQPFFFVPDIEGPNGDFPIPSDPFDPTPTPGPATGGDGLPGTDDAIGSEAGSTTGGEDGEEINFGTPPDGRVWVGCIVESTTDARIGNVPGTGPQSTVYPSIRGNVALKYGSYYGTPEQILSRFHELFRPNTALVVTGCFVQTQIGTNASVRPISAIICPESPCNSEA